MDKTTECYQLLNSLLTEYPDLIDNILESLERLKYEYGIWNNIENETLEEKENRIKTNLAWLERLKEYKNDISSS